MALSPCWPIPATHVPGQAVWAIAKWAQTTHPRSMYKRRQRHVACSRCSGSMAKITSSLRWAPWTSLCSMWTIKEVSNRVHDLSTRIYETNFLSSLSHLQNKNWSHHHWTVSSCLASHATPYWPWHASGASSRCAKRPSPCHRSPSCSTRDA